MTDYTETWNMRTIKRGDTLDGFSIVLDNTDTGDLIFPDSVCCQLKSSFGTVAHIFQTAIDPVTAVISFDGMSKDETRKLRPTVYKFDIEFLIDGRSRTYVQGTLTIEEDQSQC